MSAVAAAGLPLRAAPSARAKWVIASVYGVVAGPRRQRRGVRPRAALERVARRDRGDRERVAPAAPAAAPCRRRRPRRA